MKIDEFKKMGSEYQNEVEQVGFYRLRKTKMHLRRSLGGGITIAAIGGGLLRAAQGWAFFLIPTVTWPSRPHFICKGLCCGGRS